MGRGDVDVLAIGGSAAAAIAAFPMRGFFRSGLTWRATLSQSARSSSLRWRLRREAGISGIENDDGRFMDGGHAAVHGGAALPAAARSSDAPRAAARSLPARHLRSDRWLETLPAQSA